MKLNLNTEIKPSKKLIAFDVDNTLSISRSKIDVEMVDILKKLLSVKKVAIITGGAFTDIRKQVLDEIGFNNELNKNLTLLPTNGGSLFTFDKEWREIYGSKLSPEKKEEIIKAIKEVEELDSVLKNNISYGQKIQDRDSQITYSACGENAPQEVKKVWDPDFQKRKKMQAELMKKLPDFEVKIGGTTSIDITPKGTDKSYAIKQIMNYFEIDKEDILFFGDAVYENGNDYPVYLFGIDTVKVSNPEETKDKLIMLLNNTSI